jgi:hypothetical protein
MAARAVRPCDVRLIERIVRGLPIFEHRFGREAIAMKKLFAAALLMLVGLMGLAGCRICASPYDDCYPVIEDNYPQAHQMPAEDDGYYSSSNARPNGNSAGPRYTASRPTTHADQ